MAFEPLSDEEQQRLAAFRAQPPPVVFPQGPLPVLPISQTQPARLPPASSFRPLLGGREAAIEGPPIPPWLSVAHEIVPALVGSGAAALSAPAAPLAGPLAPAVPAAAFAGGTMATERAMRAGERAAGFHVPPEPTTGETALEFGTQALAFPLGEKIPPLIGAGFRRAAGFTGRASDLAKAAEDMTTKLRKLDDLHISVGSDVAQLGGRQQKAQTLATAAVKKQAKELYDVAPQSLLEGRAPLYTATELGARAQNLGTSAALRAQDVAPIEKAYRTVATGLGDEYEKLVGAHVKEDVPPHVLQDFGKKLQDELAEKQFATSGGIRSLLEEGAQWGPQPTQQLTMGGVALGPGAGTSGGQPLTIAQTEPVKWERLKRMRSELRPFLTARNPADRTAASILDRAITDAYEAGRFPVDPELNARYADWRRRWTPQNVRTLHNARTIEDLKPILHEDTLGPFIGQNIEPGAIRNAVGHIVRTEGLTPAQIMDRFSPATLKSVFGPGADTVAGWDALDKAGMQVPQLLQSSPALQQTYRETVQSTVQNATKTASSKIKVRMIKFLDSLGAAGMPMRRQVAQMTPEEATMFYFRSMRMPEFGQRFVDAARQNTPIKAPTFKGMGAVPFAMGLAASEIMHKGEVTSPYAVAVPIAIGGELMFGFGRNAFLRLAESEGLANATRLLNQIVNPATRQAATKALARTMGRMAVSDSFRTLLSPSEEEQP